MKSSIDEGVCDNDSSSETSSLSDEEKEILLFNRIKELESAQFYMESSLNNGSF